MFALVVRFDLPDAATAEAFDAALERVLPGIADEPGTLTYLTHRVEGDPLARVFYEVYRDRAALDEHETRPATAEFLATIRALVVDTRVEFLEPGPGTPRS